MGFQVTPLRNRPSKVDFFLADRPADRSEIEAIALDPLKKTDDVAALLSTLGFTGGRSGVAVWRRKLVAAAREIEPLTASRQHLLVAAMAMTQRELERALRGLPRRLADARAIGVCALLPARAPGARAPFGLATDRRFHRHQERSKGARGAKCQKQTPDLDRHVSLGDSF